MKDDNLDKAIKNLPEFEAPNIWSEIDKALSHNGNNKLFWFGSGLLFFTGLLVCALTFTNDYPKQFIPSNKDQAVSVAGISEPEVYAEQVEREQDALHYKPVRKTFISENRQNTSNNFSSNDNDLELPLLPKSSWMVQDFYIPNYKTVVTYKDAGKNLVNNPSFEDYTRCPKGIVDDYEKKLIPMWEVPSRGTPDYFNSCSKGDAGVPNNFAGKAWAHSGSGYCGVILRQNFTKDNKITGEKNSIYREYIQTELKSELVKGKKYRVQFWICNSSKSRYAVDAVGVCLTSEKVQVNHREVMELVPQIENPASKFISNRDYWIAVEGIYEAKGGEKFITIGNFYNNFSTNYRMIDGNSDFNYAYYYIDDVSVVEVSESFDLVANDRLQDSTENICAVGDY